MPWQYFFEPPIGQKKFLWPPSIQELIFLWPPLWKKEQTSMTDFSMYFKTFGMEHLAEPLVYLKCFVLFCFVFVLFLFLFFFVCLFVCLFLFLFCFLFLLLLLLLFFFYRTEVPIDYRKEEVHHLNSFAPAVARAGRALAQGVRGVQRVGPWWGSGEAPLT